MPTDMTTQKNADAEFFDLVKIEPKYVETLSRLGFDAPWTYVSLGNAGMGVSKQDALLSIDGSINPSYAD